jgi:fatty aldehyde-generating acyl-ACP reductase
MGHAAASLIAREGRTPERRTEIDFALIGHQESWRSAADVLAVLRGDARTRLPDEEIREIFPWIPPRAVCNVEIASATGAKARGLYIDCFIPPDRLDCAYLHENLGRVRAAAACAINRGARIVSLGGFSSVLIEGNLDQLPEKRDTIFTTGNTLTVAFIVQGIKKMCALEGRNISKSTLLIVGATGDVGSGCARCLAPFVKRVMLYARNAQSGCAHLESSWRQMEPMLKSQPVSINFRIRPTS